MSEAQSVERRRLVPLRTRRHAAVRDITVVTAAVGFGLATSVVGLGATATVVLMSGIGYCALASGYVLLRGRRITAYARELVELLDAGRVDEAEAHAAAMASERNRVLRAVGLHDLGYVKLRTGRYGEALALFARVRGAPVDWKLLDLQANEGIAMAHALGGDLEAARHWSRELTGPDFGVPTTEVVVDCRLGQFDEALARELAPRSALVHRYLDHEIRVIHLMRAYAMQRTGRAAGPAYTEAHGAAQPGYPTEYDYLAANWPELRTYLERHPWPDDALPVRAALPNAAELPAARVVKR